MIIAAAGRPEAAGPGPVGSGSQRRRLVAGPAASSVATVGVVAEDRRLRRRPGTGQSPGTVKVRVTSRYRDCPPARPASLSHESRERH